MLSAARSLIFPSFLKKSTKSTKAHLQSQEYSFWLFLARLSDLYCGNVSKKRFLTSLNVKKFFFISKSFFACCLYYCNIRAKLAETQPIFKLFHRLGYAIAYWLVGISCPKAVSLEWFSQCLFPPIIINKDINAFFIC